MPDTLTGFRCEMSSVVHYTRRDGRTSSVFFTREIVLPFKPSVGDLLRLDGKRRPGEHPAPGFVVEGVSWSASDPGLIQVTGEPWYFQPPNCFHLPFAGGLHLISFRLVLGLHRIFDHDDEEGDDDLFVQCREAETAWAATEESEDA
jgi:hypothetical protein